MKKKNLCHVLVLKSMKMKLKITSKKLKFFFIFHYFSCNNKEKDEEKLIQNILKNFERTHFQIF